MDSSTWQQAATMKKIMFSKLTDEKLPFHVLPSFSPYFSRMVASAMKASVIVFLISATVLAMLLKLLSKFLAKDSQTDIAVVPGSSRRYVIVLAEVLHNPVPCSFRQSEFCPRFRNLSYTDSVFSGR